MGKIKGWTKDRPEGNTEIWTNDKTGDFIGIGKVGIYNKNKEDIGKWAFLPIKEEYKVAKDYKHAKQMAMDYMRRHPNG